MKLSDWMHDIDYSKQPTLGISSNSIPKLDGCGRFSFLLVKKKID